MSNWPPGSRLSAAGAGVIPDSVPQSLGASTLRRSDLGHMENPTGGRTHRSFGRRCIGGQTVIWVIAKLTGQRALRDAAG